MANVVGKRYRCTKCGCEFIVTKGGNGNSCIAAASPWNKRNKRKVISC